MTMADIFRNLLTDMTFVCYIGIALLSYFTDYTSAEVQIELTAPVNPVEENAILSIHCQIWELQEGEEVSLYRLETGGIIPKRLTLGDDVSTEDERMFLATRTPMDGSTIYFLSIMDVNIHDGGEYSCRVTSYFGVIGAETLTMNIMYFPDESVYPACSTIPTIPSGGYVLYPGQQLIINCSSDRGNPAVTIEWNNTANSQINSRDILHAKDEQTVYSELTLRSSSAINKVKAVYICTIRSKYFPEKKKTCHVGPIEILPDPDISPGFGYTQTPSVASTAISMHKPPKIPDGVTDKSLVCQQQCNTWSQTSVYWIVTTVATIVVASVLFITCVTLLLRYNRIPSYQDPQCITVTQQHNRDNRDDIYTELDCRRSDNKLYLAIDKRDDSKTQLSKPVHSEFEEFHYVASSVQTMH